MKKKGEKITPIEQDGLLEMITRITASILNTKPDLLDKAISKMLGEIGTYIGVDRVYLFRHDYDRQVTINTHEWCASGIKPEIENLQALPFDRLSEMLDKLMAGEVIHVASVADMPESDPLRRLFESQDIQSLILLPTMDGNKCLGFVGFDAVRSIRVFTDEEINLLRILSELVINAEFRKRSYLELQETRDEIAYRSKLSEALFKNSTDAIIYFDSNNIIIDVNSNFLELFGFALKEIKGKDIDEIIDKGKPGSTNRGYTKSVLSGKPVIAEGTRYNKQGQPIELTIKGIPVIIDNELQGGYTIYTDITKQKRAEEALINSEKKYREILASIEDGFFEVNLKGNITFCNEAAARMLGYNREEFLGMSYRSFCKNHELVFSAFNKAFLSGETQHALTFEMVKKDGSEAYGELSLSLVKDKEGNLIGFRGIGRDVTERKHYEDQLKYLSLHDQLTGLYNRAYFENELQRLNISREHPITIISIDLDGLKLVNDTIGHEYGDQLLVACARVLKKTLRSSDILARVGGDEFTALLPRTDNHTGEEIAERIQAMINNYNDNIENQLPLSISLGLSTAESEKKQLQDIFKEADDLMYRAKLHKGVDARSQIIMSLMAALGERDFITEGHARRLEDLCCKVGEQVGLSKKQLSDLILLAQVHDLGKVGIPDKVLFKQAQLTEDEWVIMKQHSEKGYRIASSSNDLAGIADLILKHHERWDGLGYPLGIRGEDIPVECRILSIVDAYDAMTNDRPYRKAMPAREALRELKAKAGSQFDPSLVDTFLTILR